MSDLVGNLVDRSSHNEAHCVIYYLFMILSSFFISKDRDRAIEMGQALIDRHFGHQVKDQETFTDSDAYFRLLDDDDSSALNSGELSDCQPRPGL